MTPHLPLSQLTLLVVGIFLIGGLLILLIYVREKQHKFSISRFVLRPRYQRRSQNVTRPMI